MNRQHYRCKFVRYTTIENALRAANSEASSAWKENIQFKVDVSVISRGSSETVLNFGSHKKELPQHVA